MNWRTKRYGRLTGGEIETLVFECQGAWDMRSGLIDVDDTNALARAVEKLSSVPNWAPCYEYSFIELIGKLVTLAGVAPQLQNAVRQGASVQELLEIVNSVPDEAPDHPAALPIAFAMVGNLDAIARYSRSVNDMLIACRDGDVEALYQALSIDSVLITMPYFQALLRISQLTGQEEAVSEIFTAVKGPHKKRLDYPVLRWTEYLLRDQGAFSSCTKEEIYSLVVEHLGLYDSGGTKKDPKAALFALFRAWQREAGIKNPRFGFSAERK